MVVPKNVIIVPYVLIFSLIILTLGEPDILDKIIQLLNSISNLIDRILIK